MNKRIVVAVLITLSIIFVMVQAQDDITLELDKQTYTGAGDQMKITLNAPSNNKNIRVAEQAFAEVFCEGEKYGITLMLNETEKNSGIFSGKVLFSLNGNNNRDSILHVKGNTIIHVKCQGLEAEAQWIPYDASLNFDADKYYGLGASPKITVTDNDMNIDPNKSEEITVNVKSSSDPIGVPILLKEESSNSGAFKGCINLSASDSDPKNGKLKVKYNDEIYVEYRDNYNTSGIANVLTDSAVWTPQAASLKLNSSSFTGLNSVCHITVTDVDMNLNHDICETLYVKVTSDRDISGISPKLYETGTDTGVFTGDIYFSRYDSSKEWNIISVGDNSTIKVSYCDGLNDENRKYTDIEASASFRFYEGTVSTTIGSQGRSMVITVKDADADNNKEKNLLPVTIDSSAGTEELLFLLEETGASSGEFRKTLYLSTEPVKDKKKKEDTLMVAPGDEVRITYNDQTVPTGSSNIKTCTQIWEYQKAEIGADRKSVTGYNSSVVITVIDAEANKNKRTAEKIKVMVTSAFSTNCYIILSETGADSGKFKGTLLFGKKENNSKNTIKAMEAEKIALSYEDQGEYGNDKVELFIEWKPDTKKK